MLCSNCHQPIPPGQEIQIAGGWFWWGGIFCKKCSIQKKQNQKIWMIGYIVLLLVVILLPIITLLLLRNK